MNWMPGNPDGAAQRSARSRSHSLRELSSLESSQRNQRRQPYSLDIASRQRSYESLSSTNPIAPTAPAVVNTDLVAPTDFSGLRNSRMAVDTAPLVSSVGGSGPHTALHYSDTLPQEEFPESFGPGMEAMEVEEGFGSPTMESGY